MGEQNEKTSQGDVSNVIKEFPISVLMSVYHRENPSHLVSAIQSIISQTFRPSEFVLVKDGPLTPELENVISRFSNDYPKLFNIITLERNLGLGSALRVGVNACHYNIVARMDSDDVCPPNRFEVQYSFLLKHPEIDVIGAALEDFDSFPGDLKTARVLPISGSELRRYAKYRSPVNHATIMFKKSAVINCGNYDGNIKLFEDFTLFARMIQAGCQFYNLPDVLYYYRGGAGIEGIKRRSGLHYAKSEIRFLSYAYRIGYLMLHEYLLSLFVKVPIRLLPPKLVLFLYNNFLRRG